MASDDLLTGLGKPALFKAFTPPVTLVTNEYAHWNANHADAVKSPDWDMTSGTLYAYDGHGWTGVPDGAGTTNATSSAGNDSAVFRLNTKRFDFGNVMVSMRIFNRGLTSTTRTPAKPYDGINIWLRYQTEYNLYCLHVNRRDGHTHIEKKIPGGTQGSGTYYILGTDGAHVVPYNAWETVGASAVTNADGSVTLSIYINGALVQTATDTGALGGPPITTPGAVGVRGDNCDFLFDGFTVVAS